MSQAELASLAIPALTSTTARATELLQTTPRGPRPPHRMLHQEIVQQLLAMVEAAHPTAFSAFWAMILGAACFVLFFCFAALGPEPRVLFYCFAILGLAPCVLFYCFVTMQSGFAVRSPAAVLVGAGGAHRSVKHNFSRLPTKWRNR